MHSRGKKPVAPVKAVVLRLSSGQPADGLAVILGEKEGRREWQ
jgi:hypothetical protein